MSLKKIVEAVVDLITSLQAAFEVLQEEKRAGGNPPPEVSVHSKMMRRWPTDQQRDQAWPWPPFEGVRKPLGGR